MSMTRWLDTVQRRHRALSVPLAVLYKYLDDQGPYLAALITYYGFISIFPLLLLLSAVLGFVLQSDPGLQQQILDSAFAQIPAVSTLMGRQALQGSGAAVVVGSVGALYGALGVAQAIQFAMNSAWNIPRNRRPNPILARLRSLGLLSLLGLSVLASTILSQLGASLASLGNPLSGQVQALAAVGSFAISVGWFLGASRIGLARTVSLRLLIPGAVLGGVLWQVLQYLSQWFLTSFVSRTSTLNLVFAVVLGLLAWLYLAATSLVLSTEVNVVLAQKLYPRSLLTPMTDNVDLTPADQRVYVGRVRAQRLKGFQRVDVTFDYDGQYASAQRAKRDESDAAVVDGPQGTDRGPDPDPGADAAPP